MKREQQEFSSGVAEGMIIFTYRIFMRINEVIDVKALQRTIKTDQMLVVVDNIEKQYPDLVGT